MSEEHEMCSYVSYDADDRSQISSADNALPARYRTRQTPRGGKRRKTTLAKRQQSLVKLEKQLSREFSSDEETSKSPPPGDGEERYKIPSDDSGSSVDEDYEVDSIASSIEETLTWRGRMQVALHSTGFHGLIVALVIADALIVIFELLLDVGAFGNLQCEGETLFEQKERCHYEDPERCRPTAKLILEQLNISTSPGRGVGEDGLCTCKFRRGLRVCADKDGDVGVNPAVVLHVTSIIILTLFVFEIILKLIAFRLKYFTHKFEVFDGTIVFLSYLLDLASLAEEEAFEAASLVIILRLWRVVRIVNG
jgi:tetrahydromethanopterin S-methyltransferase subunit F